MGTRGRKLTRIAPRGSAKTTYASKAFPLYCVCENVEPYTLLLSDSAEQSESFLDAIKGELEDNPHIARAYPDAAGVGPVWQSGRIRTRNGCMIATKGAGGRIRGLTKRHRRPTLVIVDDPNEDADAYSETKRRRKLNWLMKGVLPIGEPTTNFVCVGTAIHSEAIPCELSRHGGWDTRSYRSVIEWPSRNDLWHEWELLYTNLANQKRGETARAFYEANHAEMDRGAQVLWPARFPLYELMCLRATMGESAFACEYQDEPGTSGATEWPSEYFNHPDFWVDALPSRSERLNTVQSLDPSKGVNDRPGDWQAHVAVALCKDGVLYFDADFRREDVKRMVERSADLADLWGSITLVAEANSTMGFLAAEYEELIRGGRLPNTQLKTMTNTDHKSCRIREVGLYLARHRVRVVNGQGGRDLVRQWRDWPNGQYDDGPDAAGVAVRYLASTA